MAKNTQTFNGDIAFVNGEASGEIKANNLVAKQVLTKGLVFTLNQSEDGYIVGAEDGATFNGYLVLPDYYNGLPVVEIAERGFTSHSDIKHVKLPQYLQIINDYAFAATTLTDIELPLSVNDIGSYAFFMCAMLEKVIAHPLTPPALGVNPPFQNINIGCKLYVAPASLTLYQSAWAGTNKFVLANIGVLEHHAQADTALNAYCDENGDDIVNTYAKQAGTYSLMTAGNAINTAFTNVAWTELDIDTTTGYVTLPAQGTYFVKWVASSTAEINFGIVETTSGNTVLSQTSAYQGTVLKILRISGTSCQIFSYAFSDMANNDYIVVKSGKLAYKRIK